MVGQYVTRATGHPWRKALRTIFFYLIIILTLVPFLFVFFWMILSSFKSQVQNTAYPPVWVFTPTLTNYINVFRENDIVEFAKNSFIVAFGATAIGLLLGLPAAYSIARYKQQGLGLAILIARIQPGISFLIPLFVIFTKIKLIDTYLALILTHLIVTLPIIVWMMISYFEDIPAELEDSALVDGCNTYSAFWRIALPLTRPGIAASAILAFIFSWNNFLFSLVLSSYRTKTLPVAVFNFMSYEEINWGGLTAAATLITLPVLLLVLLVQRHIVRGLTIGAVKG
jgi:multiple sugar transport system permease protein